jgi:hypothetical protein
MIHPLNYVYKKPEILEAFAFWVEDGLETRDPRYHCKTDANRATTTA